MQAAGEPTLSEHCLLNFISSFDIRLLMNFLKSAWLTTRSVCHLILCYSDCFMNIIYILLGLQLTHWVGVWKILYAHSKFSLISDWQGKRARFCPAWGWSWFRIVNASELENKMFCQSCLYFRFSYNYFIANVRLDIIKKTSQQLILTYAPAFSCCFMKFHPSKRCVAVKPIASASILIHAVHKNKQNVESILRLLFFKPESIWNLQPYTAALLCFLQMPNIINTMVLSFLFTKSMFLHLSLHVSLIVQCLRLLLQNHFREKECSILFRLIVQL